MNKNDLYNNYLKGQFDEFELIKSLDSLQQKQVKNDGVIYTPTDIVDHMIKICDPSLVSKIIEPSCGHGVFIFSLIKFISEKYSIGSYELKTWFVDTVVAVDISLDTVNDLKLMLSLYFKKHYDIDLNSDMFTNIITADSLSLNFEDNYFDLAIGNPPYIRTKNLDENYLLWLRDTYKSCKKGNIDIYYAFIEKYFNNSKELCFITPNSFINNVSGKSLRHTLSNNIESMIDFKEKLVFQDARTYTCILKTNKNKQNDDILYGNDINENLQKVKYDNIFNDNGINLKNSSVVLSGIATLCDAVYTAKLMDDNKFYITYENEKFEIEKDIVVPFLKLTKIKNSTLYNFDYILFPYDNNAKIIKEDDLISNYPLAYKYLCSVRKRLDMRDKGKVEKYETWYAYGRKQGIYNIILNDVIIVPQMIGKDCLPQLIDLSHLTTLFGRILFTSGFIIPYTNDELHKSILSNNFIDYAKSNGKAWPGKDVPYYSLTAKQIRNYKE